MMATARSRAPDKEANDTVGQITGFLGGLAAEGHAVLERNVIYYWSSLKSDRYHRGWFIFDKALISGYNIVRSYSVWRSSAKEVPATLDLTD